MTAIDAGQAPVMVGTQPPPRRPKLQFGGSRDNPFENIPLAAYEQAVWKQTSPLGSAWLISDPAGLKHLLLDNVANYPKTDMEQRFFRALFGDGLLSSEGEKWRSHRRIMAPSFDPRSVAGYAPAMAEVSASYADRWAQRDGTEIDVSDEMTNLTLEIICRAMFSAEGGEMAGMTG